MRTADRRAGAVLAGLTYLRVLLTPVVMALILAGRERGWGFGVAAWLFAFAAITDFFDGRLARRWKRTTPLGNFLDTTADKLLVAGVLIALVEVDRTTSWIAAVIVGRELLILGLRGAVSATEGTVVAPSLLGKAKANVQFVAITLAIWRPDVVVADRFVDQWAMLLAALVTVWSAVDYLGRFVGRLTRQRA
ncbi:MAG TPA: CDP-diacylglycerol--glycerol-3-phosphate 3-phosphatidyltransferase [Actinomycetota bacterium]|nr:CDP-diacylglycerol--glycerol-3-phosphate 3-phosphatidyltransferase [Actinomycetota bacterium]